jgi:hypothetical protein
MRRIEPEPTLEALARGLTRWLPVIQLPILLRAVREEVSQRRRIVQNGRRRIVQNGRRPGTRRTFGRTSS